MEQVYPTVQTYFEMIVEWAILLCELIGVAVIVITVIKGVILWAKKDPHVKLMIAEGIALALTFKMGGELLRSVVVLLLLALFSTPYPRRALAAFRARRGRPAEAAVTVLVFLVFFFSVAARVASDYSPFLYTRF